MGRERLWQQLLWSAVDELGQVEGSEQTLVQFSWTIMTWKDSLKSPICTSSWISHLNMP